MMIYTDKIYHKRWLV